MRGIAFASCAACLWKPIRESRDIAHAVALAVAVFRKCSIPEPDASAEYLAMKAFELRSRRDARCGKAVRDWEPFIRLCKQRQEERMPVQYLVGEWDFHHINLVVRKPVLIPRPETEELVELVLASLGEDVRLLDVGCGSGAILLAALQARRDWTGVGVDVSVDAVELSRENMRRLQLEGRAEMRLGGIAVASGVFDAIVSNPPYIADAEAGGLEREVVGHEDGGALFGGADGMDVIREILAGAARLLKEGGSVWMEVDVGQVERLSGMRFEGVRFEKGYEDFTGRLRFCEFRLKEK